MLSKFADAEITAVIMVYSERSLPRKNRPLKKRLDRSRGRKSIHQQEGNTLGNAHGRQRRRWNQTMDSEFMRPV